MEWGPRLDQKVFWSRKQCQPATLQHGRITVWVRIAIYANGISKVIFHKICNAFRFGPISFCHSFLSESLVHLCHCQGDKLSDAELDRMMKAKYNLNLHLTSCPFPHLLRFVDFLCFQGADADGDGMIDYKELSSVLRF